jgi:hypothetical protein
MSNRVSNSHHRIGVRKLRLCRCDSNIPLSKSGRYWLRYSVSCKHHHGAVSEFSFPSSQHACPGSKSLPIGTSTSIIRSTRIGNDFHVSHVEIGLIVLEIRLVVDSSSSQEIIKFSSLWRTLKTPV